MADKVSQQLWDRLMAGTSPSRMQTREPQVESRSVQIMRAMRGDTDFSDIHERNAEAQQQQERDVRARARALASQNVPHPEATARAQIRRETQQAAERERQRQTYEAMSQSSEAERERAKWEQRANKPIRPDRAPEPGAPYVTPDGQSGYRRDRTAERLMAQYHGADATVWNLYQQEQAGA